METTAAQHPALSALIALADANGANLTVSRERLPGYTSVGMPQEFRRWRLTWTRDIPGCDDSETLIRSSRHLGEAVREMTASLEGIELMWGDPNHPRHRKD